MKVKEFLNQVGFKAIFEYIGSFTGAFYSENFIAAGETFDALTNEGKLKVNPAIAEKYKLEQKVALYKKLPENYKTPEDAVASTYYDLLSVNGRSYPVSERYVKNLADFSECEVVPVTHKSAVECAALIVLSFSVLHENLKEVYGDVSAMRYISILKSVPPFGDNEDDE